MLVYLDNAAATPVDSEVWAAMLPYFSDKFYNPSATYLPARQVGHDLGQARQKAAELLGAKANEITFVAGGTEGNNLAIRGVLELFPNSSVTVTSIEHDSVLAPAQQYNCSVTFVTKQGRVDLDDLKAKITDKTVLVSSMYANNEIGTIQPIKQIAALVATIRKQRRAQGSTLPLYLHIDACQAGNYLDLHVNRLGVDLMTLNGGKLYGPKQSGVLYIRRGVHIAPQILGGGQERGLRSGTENVAAAIGFAAALEKSQKLRSAESKRLSQVQKIFFDLCRQKIPGATVNGSMTSRLPNNLHLSFVGQDNERLLLELEKRGFLAAAGSACSASSDLPSHVLRAIGLTDAEARTSVRFTMGRSTQEKDIVALGMALQQILR
ncbi:cysteine desulfurase [Candidatus Saccharibacteria bacterium]|jgi:cysteine desulfurase|nr:cysteine desulfurase [Candidatus Saccharibacteria bacterium]HPR09828.1 cysteine desulfurase family protein [Candidatus Saccharibacteria bacterium]